MNDKVLDVYCTCGRRSVVNINSGLRVCPDCGTTWRVVQDGARAYIQYQKSNSPKCSERGVCGANVQWQDFSI